MPAVRGGADKWKRRSQAAAADFTAGVQRPRRSWQQSTKEAAASYEQGVQQAIAEGRFARGVERVSDQEWQTRTATLGSQRFAQGVAASGDRYERNFAPYKSVIEGTQLPARGPKGDPANYERARAMGEALHEAKRQGTR